MDIEWYLAELVMEIRVQDDVRNVVHQNMILFSAYSVDEAYTKALKNGLDAETTYDNPAGKQVTIRFAGVSHLSLIEEELSDGSELMFSATVNMPVEKIINLIPAKDKLRAFLPRRKSNGPDYASAAIVMQAERLSDKVRPD